MGFITHRPTAPPPRPCEQLRKYIVFSSWQLRQGFGFSLSQVKIPALPLDTGCSSHHQVSVEMYRWTPGPSSLSQFGSPRKTQTRSQIEGSLSVGAEGQPPTPASAIAFAFLNCLLDYGLWLPVRGELKSPASSLAITPIPLRFLKVPIAFCLCPSYLSQNECSFQGPTHTWLLRLS